jgi:tRNA (guanosine-2'-O-)-methyltransferase
MISEERHALFEKVSSLRQDDLTVVLENVHDHHNIGAVLRSCDSVGIDEVYLIYSDERLRHRGYQKSHGSSTGISKWMQIHYFTEVKPCISEVKKKYQKLVGTVIGENSKSLFMTDLTESTALFFGNEKEGLTTEVQNVLDDFIHIPQVGFAQSLNISVACAVTLYEAYRQRLGGLKVISKNAPQKLQRYIEIHEKGKFNKSSKRISF